MSHPRVRQSLAWPVGSAVRFEHGKPNSVDAHISIGLFLEDFLLHPPGARYTDGSRGREQQNKTRVTCVLVEQLRELRNILQVADDAG